MFPALLLALDHTARTNRQVKSFAPHTVVVGERDDALVRYIDPLTGLVESVPWDDFMFAILPRKVTAASAHTLAIDPSQVVTRCAG